MVRFNLFCLVAFFTFFFVNEKQSNADHGQCCGNLKTNFQTVQTGSIDGTLILSVRDSKIAKPQYA